MSARGAVPVCDWSQRRDQGRGFSLGFGELLPAMPTAPARRGMCIVLGRAYWQTIGLRRKEGLDVREFRRTLTLLAIALCALATTASAAAAAHATGRQICTGSGASPGVLVGTYSSNVLVEGTCLVSEGPALVEGNLTVSPGSVLVAAFASPLVPLKSDLTVQGNLHVERGATLILGCDFEHFSCLGTVNPTGSVHGAISGNLIATQALGILVHDSTIGASVHEVGGGGGFNCEPNETFMGNPAYSTFEDTSVGGNLDVIGLTSCWLGIARAQVGGNVNLVGNQLADPDAIEILSNDVGGNLHCQNNSQVWDSAEENPASLFPRIPQPNTVAGHRLGQCVLASPTSEGGSPGPGPF